jgi:hypothetical protein
MAISRSQMGSQLKGNRMPVKKVKGGYKFGSSGKVYPSRAGAERQQRAAYANGYRGMSAGGKVSTGDDAKDLELIRMGKGGKTKKKSKSRVNEAGNYTQPEKRKRIFNRIKAGGKGGKPGQWSARKAQMLAKAYKKAGGGYRG